MRPPAGGVAGGHHVAAQDGLHVVGITLEGYMGKLDTGALREFFHRQMRAGADAGGPIGEFLGVGLGVGHQVLDALDRRVGRYHQAKGVAGQAGDPGEIFQRVVSHLLHVRNAENAVRQLRQGVAVGLGVDHLDGAQHAAGAGFGVDDDGLAQRLAGAFCQRAYDGVGGAAGRPGADVFDGSGRVSLRPHQGRQGHTGHGGGGAGNKRAAIGHESSPEVADDLKFQA